MATFFFSFVDECFCLICTHSFTVFLFLPLCHEIWRIVFFYIFFLTRGFPSFSSTLSRWHPHTPALSHTSFFRALGDFSFTASRWPHSLLLGLSGSNLESFRIRNPKELFWGFKGKTNTTKENQS